MKSSTEIKELLDAFARMQGALKAAPHNSKNPFYNSRYTDLLGVTAACRDLMAQNGLSVFQTASTEFQAAQIPAREVYGKDYDSTPVEALRAIVGVSSRINHASGQWIESDTPLRAEARDSSAQSVVAVVTYLKRASLAALVGVVTGEEDDDGETAVGRGQRREEPPAPPSKREIAPDSITAKRAAKSTPPARPAEPPQASLDPAHAGTLQSLIMCMRERLGITERDAVLAWVSKHAGRTVTSRKDLYVAEMRKLIDLANGNGVDPALQAHVERDREPGADDLDRVF